MKRFAFRLERIRELRERAERAQASVMGAAMRAEEALRDSLVRAQRDFDTSTEQVVRAGGGPPQPAGALRNFELTRAAATARIDLATESLQVAQGEVVVEKERYGEKRRELRIVELLREKRLGAWKEDVSRAEQKDIDHVALQRRSVEEEK